MPFIDVKASCEITRDQEERIKAGLGQAIALIPGKNESHLMLQLTDCCRMWHAGKQDGPIVMTSVAILGETDKASFQQFGAAAVSLFQQELGAKHVYLKLHQTSDWAF